MDEVRDQARRQVAEERQKLDKEIEAVRTAETRATAMLQQDHERERQELQRKFDTELRDLREQLAIEKESWEGMFMRKQEAEAKRKEDAMREALRAERNQEIEMIIARLEAETSAQQKETERQFEQRLQRQRESLEAQLQDLQSLHRAALAKLGDTQREVATLREQCSAAQGVMALRDSELQEARGEVARLQQERADVAAIVKQEFAEQQTQNEAEIVRLAAALAEARAELRAKLVLIQEAKDRELDELHERVRQVVAKRDELIAGLRDQLARANERADHLYQVLETQRLSIAQAKKARPAGQTSSRAS